MLTILIVMTLSGTFIYNVGEHNRLYACAKDKNYAKWCDNYNDEKLKEAKRILKHYGK